MVLIRDVVKQAIVAGYLSLEAENEIQQIFSSAKCELEDLNAFMSLQLAAMAGRVKQQSLESIDLQPGHGSPVSLQLSQPGHGSAVSLQLSR